MEQRRAHRAVEGRVIAGVCSGIAQHVGMSDAVVRVLFVLAALLGKGAGLLAYLAFWALLPIDPAQAAVSQSNSDRRAWNWLIVGVAATCTTLLTLAALGYTSLLDYLLPLSLAVIGIALVWTRADEVQRAKWAREAAGVARDAAAETGEHDRWRVLIGGTAVVAAIVILSVTRVGADIMLQGLATSLLLAFGIFLASYPWVHERWRRITGERAARIRADERAEIAARIHDSVLQTLTLLQKHAHDPHRVQQLARAEERELREWLYGDERSEESVIVALQHAAHDVEARHGVHIDVVAVGDAPVDSRVEALLAAAQEAMVNAAKHSGVQSAQVFAEVEPEAISVFVRDRGSGFDADAIASDRAGIRESIEGRMERAGGRAVIRTREGDGTEVELQLPRATS